MALEAGSGEAQMGADMAVAREEERVDAKSFMQGAGESEDAF